MRKAQLSISVATEVIDGFDEKVSRGTRSKMIEEWMRAFIEDRLHIDAETQDEEDYLR